MTLNRDLQNTLCLACFSSILSKDQVLHITNCCNQVICNSCIRANPRLATYDPCLACLGGVGATRGKTKALDALKVISSSTSHPHAIKINDGETMFTLGDDSDEEAEEQEIRPQGDTIASSSYSSTPPAYQRATNFPTNNAQLPMSTPLSSSPDVARSTPNSPTVLESASQRYYINPQDTIHGIALRFGVNARELCQYNKLPFSTLSTTPHLLHTRVFLELPPSSKPVPLRYVLSEKDQAERDARHAKERAQKRLQMVTKEVDWRVAKTYVALADDPEIVEELVSKRKEGYGSSGSAKPAIDPSNAALESRAVDMYFEDEEWERSQLSASHSAKISPFPVPRRPVKGGLASVVKSKWWSWES